ncbi:hypothetical protein DFP72DRAFT_841664 [Ephemerocybe angulata]|uniref:Uncharacterized protein n=1 Tax=Ephemerocybe angulata TaxID=980116 RepID=A0A8H6MFP9_9AGAR|nr:hypothetical protein DFP72DRAFT_841664 [Tulosesus angulatus]
MQVGWVTCDNATNNNTMLKWFEKKINSNKCLAHIINLASQAVITTYSATPHITTKSSPADVDSALTNLTEVTTQFIQDKVGLVRILAVKARSSAKRPQLLKDLQLKEGVQIPLNLILDMKVWWSSTFTMLQHAYDLRDVLNDFVFKISTEESLPEKQRALRNLCISQEESDHVRDFLRFSRYHADIAQHAFSSETDPALAHALPALEKLHQTWTAMSKKQKYARFHDTLAAGIEKVSMYYNKTSSIDAYNVCMSLVLDPGLKMKYFQKHWGEELELELRRQMEKLFYKRWQLLNPTSPPPRATTGLFNRGSHLDLDLSDNDDEFSTPNDPSPPIGPAPPPLWLREMNKYLNGDDELAPGQSVVAWSTPVAFPPGRCLLETTWLLWLCRFRVNMRSPLRASCFRNGATTSRPISWKRFKTLMSLINSNLIYCDVDPMVDWEFEHEVEEDDGDELWEDLDEDESDREGDDVLLNSVDLLVLQARAQSCELGQAGPLQAKPSWALPVLAVGPSWAQGPAQKSPQLGPWAEPGPIQLWAQGLARNFGRPEPTEARPKPGLSGQARACLFQHSFIFEELLSLRQLAKLILNFLLLGLGFSVQVEEIRWSITQHNTKSFGRGGIKNSPKSSKQRNLTYTHLTLNTLIAKSTTRGTLLKLGSGGGWGFFSTTSTYGELSTSLGLPSTTTPVDEQPSHSPTTPRNLKQARTWDTPKEASQDTTLDTTELPNDATPGPTDTQLPEDLEYLRLKKRRQTRALSPETNVHVEESFPGQLFTPIQSCYFGPAPDCQVEGGDGNDLLELASQQDSDWSYEHGTPTMHSEAPSEAQAADSELSLASDASDASSLPPANLTVMTTSGDQPHYETSLESTAALLLVQGEQLLNLALQHFASTIQFINRLRNERVCLCGR